MKHKLLNATLVLASLIGYLEWGKGSSTFLFSAEAHVFKNIFVDPLSVIHPFTVIPFVGQVMLIIGIFQSNPNKILTYLGIAFLSLLLVVVFLIGATTGNIKMVASALPFLITSVYTIIVVRKKDKNQLT
jgi:hypothetical protein